MNTTRLAVVLTVGLLCVACASTPVSSGGESAASDAGDLAKKTQNPVADLVSVPFQNNFNFGVGEDDDLLYVLNIQPVIPAHLSDEWNLISRVIVPVIDMPDLGPGLDGEFGLGDISYSAFLSPAKPGKLIWGVGAIASFPTATEDVLGSEKWGLGPTAVVLTSDGPWVYGALVNNVWSVAGDGDRRDVNRFLAQPFVNYNLPDGWYLTSAPILTADWKADSDDRWTIPLGAGVGKLFLIGTQPVNVSLAGYANVEKPDGAADWQLRLQIQFLF